LRTPTCLLAGKVKYASGVSGSRNYLMAEHEDDINPIEISEQSTEKPFGTTVRSAEERDIEPVRSILADWVKDPETGAVLTEEIDEIIGELSKSLVGESSSQFMVAEALDGSVLGLARISPVSEKVKQFAQSNNPVELFNLYVAAGQNKGKGVGTALFEAVQSLAREQGYTEVMLNSGPRYKESGWGFYEKVIGPPAGAMKDYYGPGYDAMVWRKEL